MKWMFWILGVLLGYIYLLYPVLLAVLARYCSRPWRRAEQYPSVTVILAVHNGAEYLRRKLSNLRELGYPAEKLDFIAVSDGSSDGSEAILRSAEGPRFQVIAYPERRGKAAALNLACERARAELIYFTDVRPHTTADVLQIMASNFADDSVGAVTGELFLRSGSHDAATQGVGLYWRFEQWIRKNESRIHSQIGVYGGFYMMRRSLLRPFPPGLILDDLFQPLSVVHQGKRVVLDERAQVWDEWPDSKSGEFKRKVRTLVGNYQLLQLAPWVLSSRFPLRWQFISHKLLRLLSPFLLFVQFVLSALLAASPVYLALFLLQAAFYAVAAVGMFKPDSRLGRLGGPAAGFCLLNWAAVVAAWRFFRGHSTDQLWAVLPVNKVAAAKKN